MIFTQTFLAIALAAFTVATPVTRADDNSTTCYFSMTPTPDLGADALQTSINYGQLLSLHTPHPFSDTPPSTIAVGHTLAEYYSGQDITVS